MPNELKPCPFCGGRAVLISGCPGCHYVKCTVCDAASDDASEERAAEKWNRRAPPSADGWQPIETAPKGDAP